MIRWLLGRGGGGGCTGFLMTGAGLIAGASTGDVQAPWTATTETSSALRTKMMTSIRRPMCTLLGWEINL